MPGAARGAPAPGRAVFISRPLWCRMRGQGDPMYQRVKYDFKQELIKIKDSGLFKEERVILSSQKPGIHVSFPAGAEPREVLNFCSNNYLGLANHPDLIHAAHEALDRYGFGLASVRFICGTQDLHKRLEERISQVLPDRGHHPLFLLLRRQRRPVRKPAGHRGRHHHRLPEPRQHHRRHPPVQGQALHLRAFRHAVAGKRPEKSPRGHGHLGRPRAWTRSRCRRATS